MRKVANLTLLSLGAGTLAALFLHSLGFAAHLFYRHWQILCWGIAIAVPVLWGFDRLLKNLPDEKAKTVWSIPFLFVGSCLSHLVGLSVGREGAAIDLGKKLGAQFPSLYEARTLGMAAAFSSLFVNPTAGLLFVIEYHFRFKLEGENRKLRFFASLALASTLGSIAGAVLQTPHWSPIEAHHPSDLAQILQNLKTDTGFAEALFAICLAGVLFNQFEVPLLRRLQAIKRWKLLLVTGLATTALTLVLGSSQYNSLGTDLLQTSLWGQTHFQNFAWKALFSLLALAGTWPGGFFVPLMTLGASFASGVSQTLGLGPSEIYAVSAVGCFLWVTPRFGCPLTCSLLTWQAFGDQVGLWALAANLGIYFFNKGFKKRPV
jgi:H+/Cl- antiporter ClcA